MKTLTQCLIHIRKDAYKFSAAHMTVYPDGTKESLHGHNYTVAVTLGIKSTSFKDMVPFSVYKQVIQKICAEWGEKVLLAENNPFFEILFKSTSEVEFKLCQKRYRLPTDETLFLNIENVSSEALSEIFCYRFLTDLMYLMPHSPLVSAQIRIEETSGQGATFIVDDVQAWSKVNLKGPSGLVEDVKN